MARTAFSTAMQPNGSTTRTHKLHSKVYKSYKNIGFAKKRLQVRNLCFSFKFFLDVQPFNEMLFRATSAFGGLSSRHPGGAYAQNRHIKPSAWC